MLSGFNTNIRHRGVLFHVQSEDSGRDHPHVITHLYHGGTILASERSGYAEHLHEPALEERVRQLMESQHKSVVRRLQARAFDAIIRERLGPEVFPESSSAGDTQPTRGSGGSGADSEAGAAAGDAAPRAFGEGIVSERPLDEVILGYLVEKARKRRRRPPSS